MIQIIPTIIAKDFQELKTSDDSQKKNKEDDWKSGRKGDKTQEIK